jgi:hypothetical protein
MHKAILISFIFVMVTTGCASKEKKPSGKLIPFKGVTLNDSQVLMVDGCAKSIDPKNQLASATKRELCTCTIVNQAKMFDISKAESSELETSKSLGANQDLCRCAVGLKPTVLKACTDE